MLATEIRNKAKEKLEKDKEEECIREKARIKALTEWEDKRPERVAKEYKKLVDLLENVASYGKFNYDYVIIEALFYSEILDLLKRDGFKVDTKIVSVETWEGYTNDETNPPKRTGRYNNELHILISWE